MDIEEILGFQPDLIFFVALALGTPLKRMLRCDSLSSLRLCCVHVCWWVSHAYACGGLVLCPSCPVLCCLLALSCLLLFFFVSLSPSLSASATGKPHPMLAKIWGRQPGRALTEESGLYHLTENYYIFNSETIMDVNNYIPFSIINSQTIDVM